MSGHVNNYNHRRDTNSTNNSGGGGSINMDQQRERLERERKERMARLRAGDTEDIIQGGKALRGGELTPISDSLPASSSSSLTPLTSNAKKRKKDGVDDKNSNDEDNYDDDEEDDEQRQMMALLGFAGSFNTTKGKAVIDNQTSAAKGTVQKNKGRKYRQYMNRKGGFNRPLDKMN